METSSGDGDEPRDLLGPLGPEGRDPEFRRYVTERLGNDIADPARRRRVMDLLARDVATLDERELQILTSALARAFDHSGTQQQDQEQWAELTLGGSDPFWPKGWPRRRALAVVGWLGVSFGAFGLATGIAGMIAMASEDLLTGLVWGAMMAGFGAAVLFGAAMTSLRFGADGAPRLTTVQDGEVIRTGVLLPYSRVRLAMGIASSGGVALCGGGLLLGTAVGLRWPGFVLGPPVLLTGAAVIVGIRRRWAGPTGLLFAPDGVVHVRGVKRTFLPWGHIFTISPSHRGFGGPPELELTVTDKAAIETTTTKPGVIRRRRKRVDLSNVIWMLTVDPSVVYAALRHYIARPDRRAELADERGIERIVRRDLVVTSRRRQDLIINSGR